MFKTIKKSKKKAFYVILAEIIVLVALFVLQTKLAEIHPFFQKIELVYGAAVIIIVLSTFVTMGTCIALERTVRKNYVSVSNTLGADMSEAYSFGEIGLLTYNEQREIIWTSNLFIERGIKIIGEQVDEKFPRLKPFFDNQHVHNDEIKEFIGQRVYSVIHIKELKVLIFKDVSNVEHLYELIKDEAPVMVVVQLDNILDAINNSVDDDYVQADSYIRKVIQDWAKENKMALKRTKDNIYFGVLTEESFQKIKEEKFKILNDAKYTIKGEISFTISISFARGTNDFSKLSDMVADAMDVARSRGGGQVVVNTFGGHMDFYGGVGSEVQNKRNAIKSRVLAQSFYTHILNSSKVFAVVHENADFDAVGAALGILQIALSTNKKFQLVYEDKQIEMKARTMLKETFTKQILDKISITPSEAVNELDDDTLVVVVDVNRPGMTTAPKLLEVAKKVAVIDHHRVAEDAIDGPIYTLIDTNASSACELMTELIMNTPNGVKIATKVATYMLAGILLDTNSFKNKASSSTFKAAMNLKEFGADGLVADEYLKDEYEEFALKTKIMSNLESPHFGIVIATPQDNQIIDRTLLARVGEEIINIKDIKAAFVVGMIDKDVVGISARSNGSINVQLIMEKLGGGGHHSAAAAQVQDKKIEEVVTELKKVMNLYINEVKEEE